MQLALLASTPPRNWPKTARFWTQLDANVSDVGSFGRGHLGVSAWHSRPLCQIIVVTAGCGWERRWGRPVEEIRRVMRSGSRPHRVEGWTAAQSLQRSWGRNLAEP